MSDPAKNEDEKNESLDFIREKVVRDLEAGRYDEVVTRFPPEPNGYLHIGHAKAICLSYGIAEEFGGRYHLRFDDTNPSTEDPEYVDSIQRDIKWLGFDWGEHLYFASDYFGRMYELAEKLVKDGNAYIDSSSEAEIRERRGSITEPGTNSPYRERSPEENLDLLRRMKAGEFQDGEHVLRAKIDMAANNMLMRDPLLLRIRHAHHYRQGDDWCLYPMYDYAHCLEDAFEGITHSLCSIEFENNRAIYDWVLDKTGFEHPRPEQTEFARLNLAYTVMSKRKLLRLVREGHVSGWDDPRMPTLTAMRRRGYTPESIRAFCDMVGVAKTYNIIDPAMLEHAVRDDLNHRARRVMAVLEPLRVVIENFPEGEVEELDAPHWPHDVPNEGSRSVPFSRRLFIDRSDFEEEPPPGFFRLSPGAEVRLRYGYVIRCDEVVKEHGEVTLLRCTYDPETRGGQTPDGRKVQGTIHWLSEEHALPAEIRLYDRLFTSERPDAEEDFLEHLNEESLVVYENAWIEPSLAGVTGSERQHVQFERLGYFVSDEDSTPEKSVWNRTVTLRDTWAKVSRDGETESALRAKERAEARRAYKEEQRRLAAEEVVEALEPEAQKLADAYMARGVSEQDARLFAQDAELAAFFDAAVAVEGVRDDAASVAPWLTTELLGRLEERGLGELPFGGDALGELAALVKEGTISGTVGKKVLDRMVAGEGRAAAIVDAHGLRAISDEGELAGQVDEILAANPKQVEAYRGGKTALLGYFIGQVMQATRGRADAQVVRSLLQEKLGS